MSNLETDPHEHNRDGRESADIVEILTPRDVPLGGPRAMRVRRTLPQRERSLIGAWCFADHYGPDDVRSGPGMAVPPHPHTGLQTVSWLFTGEIEHRDSLGTHATVRPGELNLMTAGRGIAHSEVSTPETKVLHGMQLWVALPAQARDTAPAFAHYRPEPVTVGGATLRVFLGELAGARSPVETFTELLGAEVTLDPGTEVVLAIDAGHEHGVIVDQGPVELRGTRLGWAELGYQGPGFGSLVLRNPGSEPARFLVLGGEPLGEQVVMWWNFMGRTHEEIVEYRRAWQAEVRTGFDGSVRDPRFGVVPGYEGSALPAPELPNSTLRPRG
ncbi:redox-sensitive bicupin YhaK (pirin superfamily) [Rhodococcus sp. 27YEA15]|uniref:pirin family protein n=1 Tax=Rhodococcus sp. 27YEA15 TaxID=3156259 RepID=UPI003C798706